MVQHTIKSAASSGVMSIRSPYPFADTVKCLLSAFAGKGVKVFATIDQAAEATAAGLVLPPTTLIIFGNPRAGTPLMVAEPLCGLDLPLKALVSELTPGVVTVSYNAARYILERHSLPAELLNNLAPAEHLIVGTLAE